MAAENYSKQYLYQRIVQAKLYIDSNFSENLDVNNIADEAYFSKFHFIRLFKQIYGKTPHQYLTAVRIEKAMQLLKTEQPVSEVCFSVGFESLSSFSGLFKRSVGLAPSAFLLVQKQLKEQHAAQPLRFIPGCMARHQGWIKK